MWLLGPEACTALKDISTDASPELDVVGETTEVRVEILGQPRVTPRVEQGHGFVAIHRPILVHGL